MKQKLTKKQKASIDKLNKAFQDYKKAYIDIAVEYGRKMKELQKLTTEVEKKRTKFEDVVDKTWATTKITIDTIIMPNEADLDLFINTTRSLMSDCFELPDIDK